MMSNEYPILFSGEMARAILEGRKTQTRRVMRPQPQGHVSKLIPLKEMGYSIRYNPPVPLGDGITNHGNIVKCPYGQPGDRLWVREAWRPWSWWEGERWVFQYKDGSRLEARTADMDDEDRQAEWEERQWVKISEELTKAGHKSGDDGVYHFQGDPPLKWRPSIHMPRWASRITLEVTGVRVERVRDISLSDMRAEGVKPNQEASLLWRETLTANFRTLWDTINAPRGYSWESNPWVWVVEFKKL